MFVTAAPLAQKESSCCDPPLFSLASQEDGGIVVQSAPEVDKKGKAKDGQAKGKERRGPPCACQQSRCVCVCACVCVCVCVRACMQCLKCSNVYTLYEYVVRTLLAVQCRYGLLVRVVTCLIS